MVAAEAQLAQARAELHDERLVLLEGQEVILGQLKELPLLVDLNDLAIDVLGNLLDLLVQLDEPSVAHGKMVGIHGGTAADNVPDGVYVIGGLGEQAVPGCWVATRDGLARHLFVARSLDGEGRLAYLVHGHDAHSPVRRHGGGLVVVGVLVGDGETTRWIGEERRKKERRQTWKRDVG